MESRFFEKVQDIRQIHKINYGSQKNWKMKLVAGKQTIAEVKIQRGIFQRDSNLPLQLIIEMMSFNYILRKCTGGGYKFTIQKQLITLCTQMTSNGKK